MNRITLQNCIILLNLQSIRSIFSILRCNITRGSWFTRLFVLCSLQDNLNSISFLCHFLSIFSTINCRKSIYLIYPFALASLMHTAIPFLLIVLNADVEIFNVMYSFSSGMKNFLVIKLG